MERDVAVVVGSTAEFCRSAGRLCQHYCSCYRQHVSAFEVGHLQVINIKETRGGIQVL